MKQHVILSIAGSDNTGGAGIQADIKTACAFSVYAATVITGVTAQNSHGVFGIEPVSLDLIRRQTDAIFEVMTPGALKTGMLPTPEIIEVVAELASHYKIKNLVVDPVMVATNGGSLTKPGEETVKAFTDYLTPLSTIVTPNMEEASRFLGQNVAEMDPGHACEKLLDVFHSHSVLLKGGHRVNGFSTDYLYDGKTMIILSTPRIDTANTHGTGCTLSTAIACGLAMGKPVIEAVENAKSFINKAIGSAVGLHIMRGPGPLNFFV